MTVTQEHIEFVKQPKECFFGYEYISQYPGWVIGEIRLPLVRHSNLFLLIQGFSGELFWMPQTKVDFQTPWNHSTRNIAPSPPIMDELDMIYHD
jgi:hypothetical protein